MRAEDLSIAISSLAKSKHEYSVFIDNVFVSDRCDIIDYTGRSKSSLAFARDPEDVFGIEASLISDKKMEACSGSGTSEMRTLKSSSLLALLCFFDIRRKPLILQIGGDSYVFTESHFEVKNPCVNGGYSNIDVLLIGKCEDTGRKALLFLESKFSEYLSLGPDIRRKAYRELYETIYNSTISACGLSLGEDYRDKKGIEQFNVIGNHYCAGTTQMICHFRGLGNLLDGKYHHRTKDILKGINMKESDVFLGEIVYRFDDKALLARDKERNSVNAFLDYKEQYSRFRASVSSLDERIHILPELLTYQEVFSNYGLESSVRSFYKL